MQAIQPALTVTIVRHAETMHDLIRPRIISGQESQPLTAAGKEQAKALAVRLSRVKFSEIYASDAQQAVETLEQVVQYQQGSKVFLDQRLRECNVGKISGMSYSEIIAFSNACSMSLDNFIDQDGESTESFLGRIQDFYSQLIKDSIVPHLKNSPTLTNNYEIESADTRNILAITHGGWIDSLMRFLINDLNFELETGKNDRLAYKTSIYQFKIQKVILDNYDNYEWQGVIDMMNDAGHLATLSNELNRSESVYRIPKEDPIERSFTCRKEIAAMLGFFCPFQPKYQQKSSPLAAFPVNLDFNIVHDPAQNYSEENDSEIVQKIRTLGWLGPLRNMKSNHQSRIADLLTIILGVCFPLKRPNKLCIRKIPKEIAEEFQSSTLKSLKSAPIPSNKLSRAWHYTGLATSLGLNVAKESFKNALSKTDQKSGFLTDQGTEKLVDTLKKMRGAALKLGQMLSIQEENPAFPKSVTDIMTSVQNAAYMMPQDQLVRVLADEYKSENWQKEIFTEFDLNPIAAASIGQVHRARLKNSKLVAVKVQYPGVALSISSDLSYLKSLLTFSKLLPKGLYLDNTIRVAQKELQWECDYLREANSMEKFKDLVQGRKGVAVPRVFKEFSNSKVLVSEFVEGSPLGKATILPQEYRDSIADRMLRLCLDELFTYRFMQTDPNWSNFLYNLENDTVYLIDFGAAREYSKVFTDKYMQLLYSASIQDKEACLHWSKELGFLTGYETNSMNEAHINSLFLLAYPFSTKSGSSFSFGDQQITEKVRSAIPTMLRERLTPPPDESYSLHRKLSGCFLLCTKLKAKINSSQIFQECYSNYK